MSRARPDSYCQTHQTYAPNGLLCPECADALRARVDELASLLEHIVNGFSFQDHPGRACYRTGWTSFETLAAWRTILNRK